MKLNKCLFLVLPLLLTGCVTSKDDSSGSSSSGDTSSSDTSSSSEDINHNSNKLAKNYYQLLVYSFADSNGDGIGDFKGIVDHLDYFEDLGIEALWLSPVNKCVSYHAYDVTDYYAINSQYEYSANGVTYDYKYLLDKCHEKGISVIMDLVVNHTANSHVWKSQHPDWYSSKSVFPGGMTDLDFEKQEVRQAIKEVGKYWLNKGVDGFRLDAAMWLFNTGTSTSGGTDHQKNYEYWNEWCNEMRATKSDCYIIGEVLNSNHDLSYQYAHAGFTSTFDFNAREHVYNAVTDSNYDYVGKTMADMKKATDIKADYILGRPLSNHDIGRFTQQHSDMDDAKAYYVTNFNDIRLANALNIMMKGNTFIYYGDELGLKGTCPQGWNDMNYRTPMPFATGRTNSVNYFNGFKGNGQTTSVTFSGKTVEEDMKDSNSLYASAKALLNLKKDNNAIKNGAVAKLSNLSTGLNGYTLTDSKEKISFIYNSTGSAISFDISGKVLYSTDSYTDKVSISSKGFIVLSEKM